MDRDTIEQLIREWREQSEYSHSIGDVSAGNAWNRAAQDLEDKLNG